MWNPELTPQPDGHDPWPWRIGVGLCAGLLMILASKSRMGLVGLVIGGELLVRGAVSAAKSFGISPMVIGLTLVGFGTSSPELVTSLQVDNASSPVGDIDDVIAKAERLAAEAA